MSRLKEFIYTESLNTDSHLNVLNKSNHEDDIHQLLFFLCDSFSDKFIIELYNRYSSILYETNGLTLLSSVGDVSNIIQNTLKEKFPDREIKGVENPEKIYKAYNFFKPSNLLPIIHGRSMINLKRVGLDESGAKDNYILNPYFYACYLCIVLFVHTKYFKDIDDALETGLLKILEDKYGQSFKSVYNYIASHWVELQNKATKEIFTGIDLEDLKSFSGIHDDIVVKLLYDSAVNYASHNVRDLTSNGLYEYSGDVSTIKPIVRIQKK